jgi:hypothetical protein
MNRRSFLGAMLAACAAPAIVSASSIMRIKPILLPGEDFYFKWTDYSGAYGGIDRSVNKWWNGELDQVTQTTRSQFIPKMVAQLCGTSPLLIALTR